MNNEKWIKRILLGFLFLVLLFGSYYIWNYNNAKSDRLTNKNQKNIVQNSPIQNNAGQGNITPNQKGNQATQMPEDIVTEANLRQEKEVQFGHVYVSKDLAFAPIVLKDGVTKGDAEKLVTKYADILKTKYPDREVSVQAQNMKGDKVAGLIK